MGTTKRTSPTVQSLLIALTLSGLRASGVHLVASTSVPWGGIALDQTSGICDRSQAVRDAILPKLSAVSDCADVADTHLGGITGDLTFSEKKTPAPRAGDFQGLTGLEHLYLNNNLSDPPDGVFEDLETLAPRWLNFNPGPPLADRPWSSGPTRLPYPQARSIPGPGQVTRHDRSHLPDQPATCSVARRTNLAIGPGSSETSPRNPKVSLAESVSLMLR